MRTAFVPAKLVIAVPAEPPSLNGILLEGPSATMLIPLVYSYLLTTDERSNLLPDVAATVPTLQNGGISADGKTVTYILRRNVRWQDGQPLTASDVVFTAHAIMNSANNVFSHYGFEDIAGVTAPSRYTVRVRLEKPMSTILTEFFAPSNNFGILPEHLLEGYANLNRIPFNAMPIGSGPFRVAQWQRGDHITLVRNPLYFRGNPGIAQIVLKFTPDSNTALSELRTGEVNAYLFSDPLHAAEYGRISSEQVVRAPFASFGDLEFNMSRPALSSVRVRLAIAEAIDVPQITRDATRGVQTSDGALYALFGRTYDPSIPQPRYDPAAARKVLQPLGLTLEMAIESGKATSQSVAVQLQEQLRAAGVQLDVRSYTPDMFRAPARSGGPVMSGNFDLAFFEIFTTGDWDSSWYLSCAQRAPAGFNEMHFCDPQAERALAGVQASYDPTGQRRYAEIVQRRVADLLPFVSLWSQNAIYVVPRGLQGFRPQFTAGPYWNAWQWSLSPGVFRRKR